MFTDMVGYTSLGQRDESLSLALVGEQRKLLRPILARHNGREVKTIGDAFLIEFSSALDAVRCAYDIQRATREFNISLPSEKRIHLRVGVHLGDVVESLGDISGDAVNVASRIEPLAEDGGVCLSRQVYDHVHNKFELPLASLGIKELKNVDTPIEVYRMNMPWEGEKTVQSAQLDSNRIAVLPFVNMSPDPNDEFFADGLTEELITRLYEVKGLEVIARTSVMNYKKKEQNITQIGRELNVGTVIEGSIRKAGNRIRVAAQLIDTNTLGHLWASTYDRNLDDIFAIQTDIAMKVAGSAHAAIKGTAAGVQAPETTDIEAYTDFLRGNQLLHSAASESWKDAVRFFENAVARDQSFARAYVGLAQCYQLLGNNGLLPFAEGVSKAKVPLKKALELNEGLAEAHAVLSLILWNDDDGVGAEREARKAIELNPNLPNAYTALAEVVADQGNASEWFSLTEKAYRLDPVGPRYVRLMGIAFLYSGREAEFLEHWRKNVQLDPYSASLQMTEYHALKGDFEKAGESLDEAERLQPKNPRTLWMQGCLAAAKGDRDRAAQIIERIQASYPDQPAWVGFILLGLGDLNGFFGKLEEAVLNHSFPSVLVMYSPLFAKARTDPRYGALLAMVRDSTYR